jgi:hypothetical protein
LDWVIKLFSRKRLGILTVYNETGCTEQEKGFAPDNIILALF